jgi:RNA polymerase sigma-70 factor (ECF subfamily)
MDRTGRVKLLEDHQLMRSVRNGDVAKLATLYDRHQRPLFNFFLRLTASRPIAEDLVHDVFTRILKYRSSYGEQEHFTPWMYRIARNAHIEHARRHRLEVVVADPETQREPVSPDLRPDERAEYGENIALLRRALAKLPEDKREILVLSRFQNLRYEEIARILDCEVGTVKVRVYRAVRQLEQLYNQLAGERAS